MTHRLVKEVKQKDHTMQSYFNSIASTFGTNTGYDKAIDLIISGMNNVPEDKFKAVKAFLVKEDDTAVLNVNSSGDVFCLSAYYAIEELVNELGEDIDTKNASIVLIEFTVPMDEVPDDLLFSEDRECFTLRMKDYSEKDMQTLSVLKLKTLKTETHPKTGRITIKEFSATNGDKEYDIKLT